MYSYWIVREEKLGWRDTIPTGGYYNTWFTDKLQASVRIHDSIISITQTPTDIKSFIILYISDPLNMTYIATFYAQTGVWRG